MDLVFIKTSMSIMNALVTKQCGVWRAKDEGSQ
jgi:hypothetical protein